MKMTNPVWALLKDLTKKKGITEIIINSPDFVFIEREGELIRLNVDLDAKSIDEFCSDVAKMNRRKFDALNPIIDGVLPDTSRINVISKEYTNGHPAITIRKYLRSINSLDTLDGAFLLSNKWIRFLKALMTAKLNILVSGGTGVGKTTFLNVLLQEIAPNERVVVMEDTQELDIKIPNTVRLFTGHQSSLNGLNLTMRDLVKNSLRMRPDRIIIGEVRGPEAFDLLQAMNTGHEGSMCTVHSNSTVESLMRLENLLLLTGYDLPIKATRYQIQSAIDYVIQLDKDRARGRFVAEISEVTGMEGDRILTQQIGRASELGLEFTGLTPSNSQILFESGLEKDFFSNI